MKNYDLLPVYENIKDTFLKDTLKRNEYLYRFITLLQSIDDMNCSIALDGKWGSGKTFFIKQAKLLLDVLNPYIEKDNISEQLKDDYSKILEKCTSHKLSNANLQLPVYYNAWENDNSEDPITSLIYSIANDISTNVIEGKRNIGDIIKSILGLIQVQYSIPIGTEENSLSFSFDGQRVNDIVEACKKKNEFGQISKEVTLRKEINEFLNSLLPEKANRLVIFVDELDRCKPAFAINFLERIKHYFNNENITFVFSTNLFELQNTIKKFYGQDLNATKYLDKFFDISLELPQIGIEEYFKYLELNPDSSYTAIKIQIAKYCKLELRDINRFLKATTIYNRMLLKNNPKLWNDKYWYFLIDCLAPLLIALKKSNQIEYDSFISGKNVEPLLSIFEDNLLTSSLIDYWGIRTDEWLEANNRQNQLKKVYNAIFKDNIKEPVQVGNMKIECNTKHNLMEITSLLSNYADYD